MTEVERLAGFVATHSDELARIARLGMEPWPGGPREAAVRIETETISGRRIRKESGP